MIKTNQASHNKRYVGISVAQINKSSGAVCGDYLLSERSEEATTVILCDGIGSGIKAHIAAVMCANRIMELLRLGFSLRQACERVVATMHEARTRDIPFSAFCVCRMLNDGQAAMISYEMPAAVIAEQSAASLVERRFITLGSEVIAESHFHLHTRSCLFLFSDGVTQAGMGRVFKFGWQEEGVVGFIRSACARCMHTEDMPGMIIDKVRQYSGPTYGDDSTVVLLRCRRAKTVHILTGPPADRQFDRKVIERFMRLPGSKIICGSTTADIAARCLGIQVKNKQISDAYYKPPQYEISGIDLVTEGVLTLNQACNILGVDPDSYEEDSCVSGFCTLVRSADAINMIVGTAVNSGHRNIIFRQMGVLPRPVIVQRIAEKLKEMGKLVTVEYL
ncbi:MAG: SpoIIE family protein phosphatase [Candidatus Omnitrophica bacterium]|nr:SpoIIE family protein phosphatase [Candidatus Omnitrophota bacterium]